MANEAQLRVSLSIRTGNLNYQSNPTAFLADVSGSKGPVPGALTIAVLGTTIDLSQLSNPGLCWIMNIDPDTAVVGGIYEPGSSKFFPLFDLLPGEFYIFRLSRYLYEEWGPGTASSGDVNQLRMYSLSAHLAVNVIVAAFEA